jgi:hypothetical protein
MGGGQAKPSSGIPVRAGLVVIVKGVLQKMLLRCEVHQAPGSSGDDVKAARVLSKKAGDKAMENFLAFEFSRQNLS